LSLIRPSLTPRERNQAGRHFARDVTKVFLCHWVFEGEKRGAIRTAEDNGESQRTQRTTTTGPGERHGKANGGGRRERPAVSRRRAVPGSARGCLRPPICLQPLPSWRGGTKRSFSIGHGTWPGTTAPACAVAVVLCSLPTGGSNSSSLSG
jgi:hypothetical protein